MVDDIVDVKCRPFNMGELVELGRSTCPWLQILGVKITPISVRNEYGCGPRLELFFADPVFLLQTFETFTYGRWILLPSIWRLDITKMEFLIGLADLLPLKLNFLFLILVYSNAHLLSHINFGGSFL